MGIRARLESPWPTEGMTCCSWLEEVAEVVIGGDNTLFRVSVK